MLFSRKFIIVVPRAHKTKLLKDSFDQFAFRWGLVWGKKYCCYFIIIQPSKCCTQKNLSLTKNVVTKKYVTQLKCFTLKNPNAKNSFVTQKKISLKKITSLKKLLSLKNVDKLKLLLKHVLSFRKVLSLHKYFHQKCFQQKNWTVTKLKNSS